MVSPDLSKLTLYTPDNAFKNVNKYTGTLVFPTSLAADAAAMPTVTIQLSDAPVFTVFYANFLDFIDADFSIGGAKWYDESVAGQEVAIFVDDIASYDSAQVYPVISGNTVTITGFYQNPTGAPITMQPLSVPFEFIEYTLAS